MKSVKTSDSIQVNILVPREDIIRTALTVAIFLQAVSYVKKKRDLSTLTVDA